MRSYIGKQNILENIPEILYDESRFSIGIPEKVFFPSNINELIEIVKNCYNEKKPISLIGGKTGITGSCTPIDDSIAICFSDMNKIISVEKKTNEDIFLECEPGITLESISKFLSNPFEWSYKINGILELKNRFLFYPPDPTEITAQLGGTVSTNASGARSFRLGPTRSYVNMLKIILADGDSLTITRGNIKANNGYFCFNTDSGKVYKINVPSYKIKVPKNASGYYSSDDMDLIDLFIGSEGTLGIFSRIGIKIIPKIDFVAGLSFFSSRQEAFSFACFLRSNKNVLAIEYIDQSAFLFLEESNINNNTNDFPKIPLEKRNGVYWEYIKTSDDDFENVFETFEEQLKQHGSSFDNTWAGFELKEIEKLKKIRHAIPESVNSAIAKYKKDCPDIRKISTDTAIPISEFNSVFFESLNIIENSQIKYAIFGHLGECHLHINLIPKDLKEFEKAKQIYQKLMTLAIQKGGTVSAEHGIGKLKKQYLLMMYGEEAIKEMKTIKSSLDPLWLLNRGNLFD
jgi:D-lactate dehydrogenase (cytochrome)